MNRKNKTNRGGAREGAGRPKSDVPTTTISYRVPAQIADKLKEKIAALIKKEVKSFEKSLQKSKQ